MKSIIKVVIITVSSIVLLYLVAWRITATSPKGPRENIPYDVLALEYQAKGIDYDNNCVKFNQISEADFNAIVKQFFFFEPLYVIEDTIYNHVLNYSKEEGANYFITDIAELDKSEYGYNKLQSEVFKELLHYFSDGSRIDLSYTKDDKIEVCGLRHEGNRGFSWVFSNHMKEISQTMNTFIVYLDDLYRKNNPSYINNVPVQIVYLYQTDKNMYEKYIYFGYFIEGDKAHIVQYSSNWTPPEFNSSDKRIEVSHLISQEECRDEFIEILGILIGYLS